MAEEKKQKEAKKEEKPKEAKAKKEDKKPADKVKKSTEKQALPELKPGYTVKLYQKVKEGDKERVQFFEGIVIAIKGKTAATRTITLRKVSYGVGVEKIFPLASPTINKIEIIKKARIRRSKLYYLRDYDKKLKERAVKK